MRGELNSVMEQEHWSNPGDNCPKCKSTKTVQKNFHQDFRTIPVIGGPPLRVPVRTSYTMSCQTCGYSQEFIK